MFLLCIFCTDPHIIAVWFTNHESIVLIFTFTLKCKCKDWEIYIAGFFPLFFHLFVSLLSTGQCLFCCSLTPLSLCWQSWPTFLHVYGYWFWAICIRHIALYIFLGPAKTTNKRPNDWQPNLGRRKLLQSSLITPAAAPTVLISPLTSPTLLSGCPSPHSWGLSAQSVCSAFVTRHACASCGHKTAGTVSLIACGVCVLMLTWPERDRDV